MTGPQFKQLLANHGHDSITDISIADNVKVLQVRQVHGQDNGVVVLQLRIPQCKGRKA
jgi:hypothetical protein